LCCVSCVECVDVVCFCIFFRFSLMQWYTVLLHIQEKNELSVHYSWRMYCWVWGTIISILSIYDQIFYIFRITWISENLSISDLMGLLQSQTAVTWSEISRIGMRINVLVAGLTAAIWWHNSVETWP